MTAAVPRLRSPEEANLRAPEAVVSLHLSFINAGAELIETNTFGANRRKLAAHFLEDELERDQLGRRQARARGARDLGPGRLHRRRDRADRRGDDARRERHELFAEQAAVLEGRGADLFMLETFYDLDELDDAIAAVRAVSQLPIVALLTFDEGAETLAGVERRARRPTGSPRSTSPRSARTTAPGCSPRSTALEQMQARRPRRSRRCRTSASRACSGGARRSTRTRRRTTSPSSPRTRATSARG